MPRHGLCAGRGSIPACLLGQHSASHTCPQPVLQDYGGLVPRSWLASRCCSLMEHGANSPSSHQTAPGWSQLWVSPHLAISLRPSSLTVFQSWVCSRPACLLPGSWAVSLSMATRLPTTGDPVLDKLCTSALPLPPRLCSISHQTPPPAAFHTL